MNAHRDRRGSADFAVRRTRPWRPAVSVVAAVALAGVLAACGGGPPAGGARSSASGVPSAGTAPAAGASSAAPSQSPSPAPVSRPPATRSCVARVFAGMSEAQRVGQLFLVGLAQDYVGPVTTAALEKYHFGSLLFAENTSEGAAAAASATARMQSLATQAITGRVRFFVAANQEGGQVQNLRGAGFAALPAALIQGSWSVGYLRQRAKAWGTELRSAGVNFDLAPVMDVVPAGTARSNAPIGQLDREFGYRPAVTGPHGAAFIAGMAAAGVATAAKHFPGLGRVAGNTDFTANVVDTVTTPDDPYFASYRSAISAGVPFVMVALATYTKIDPSSLAVFSPAVMRLLRSSLGFKGVIMSDDLGQAAAVADVPAGERAVRFIDAGGDMITSQSLGPAEQMARAVLSQAAASPAFRAMVNASVTRVLTAKQSYGLLPC